MNPARIWKDKWSWYSSKKAGLPEYILADLVSKLKGYVAHDPTCQKGHISASSPCTCGLTEVLKEIE